MNDGFSRARAMRFMTAFSLACALLFLAARSVPAASPAPSSPGLIPLSAAEGEKAEQPPVPFPHDLHTKAVRANGGDCVSCHRPATPGDRDHFSHAFADAGSARGEERKNIFHERCTGCHARAEKAAKPSGPALAQCRSCHRADAPSAPRPEPPVFDKALHFRHTASPDIHAPVGGDAAAGNCGACHHPTGEKRSGPPTVDACRSCHNKTPQAAGVPFRAAAHDSCIPCHLGLSRAARAGGPSDCAGCHDAAAWAGYVRPPAVPRLNVGQPDRILMRPESPPGAKNADNAASAAPSLPGAPFNHKLHEQSLPSCRSCHHAALRACSSCHTAGGDPKGGSVTWYAAMHKPGSVYSCVGCHEKRKTTLRECAGCHTPRADARQADNCAFCHKPAASAPRKETRSTGPETVRIGALSREFEPAEFPHGKVVRALEQGINNAAPSLAATHAQGYALCQSCHHNSPAGASPPNCASCHPKTLPVPPPDRRPPLQQAYHQQCMGCHQRMAVKPAATDCAGCHAKRPAGI